MRLCLYICLPLIKSRKTLWNGLTETFHSADWYTIPSINAYNCLFDLFHSFKMAAVFMRHYEKVLEAVSFQQLDIFVDKVIEFGQ